MLAAQMAAVGDETLVPRLDRSADISCLSARARIGEVQICSTPVSAMRPRSHIQAHGVSVFHDPSPMHEAPRQPSGANLDAAYCETGRPTSHIWSNLFSLRAPSVLTSAVVGCPLSSQQREDLALGRRRDL